MFSVIFNVYLGAALLCLLLYPFLKYLYQNDDDALTFQKYVGYDASRLAQDWLFVAFVPVLHIYNAVVVLILFCISVIKKFL